MSQPIRAILFDKDGTLFSFDATWGAWCAALIRDYARGDATLEQALAGALHFDLDTLRFHPTSPVIAGTADESARLMVPHLPGVSFQALVADINIRATAVEGVPPTPLRPLLDVLKRQGLTLGVATNDAEAPARRQMEGAGVTDYFDFIAGYDSGFGAKPEPGQLLAFAEAAGLPCSEIAMIGDSTHDLFAAKAAGMLRVGVLTGPADQAALAPHCDLLMNDISELPAALNFR